MKHILFFCLALLGISSAAVPEKIPFGKELLLQSLSQATAAYVSASGESVVGTSSSPIVFGAVSSTANLATAIRTRSVSFTVGDPRTMVTINCQIINSQGQLLFVAEKSFNLISKRTAQGKRTYELPQYAGDLYFRLSDRKIPVSGVEAAVAINKYGEEVELEIINGSIVIPSDIGNNSDYWNTLKVTIDGVVHYYDQNGERVIPQQFVQDVTNAQFEDIRTTTLQNGRVEVGLLPEYGYNPVIEFNNPTARQVKLAVGSYYNWHPTYVRICTLEQFRSGQLPAPIQYDSETDNVWTEEIQVTLPAGNYFLIFEWPSWLIGVGDDAGKG